MRGRGGSSTSLVREADPILAQLGISFLRDQSCLRLTVYATHSHPLRHTFAYKAPELHHRSRHRDLHCR